MTSTRPVTPREARNARACTTSVCVADGGSLCARQRTAHALSNTAVTPLAAAASAAPTLRQAPKAHAIRRSASAVNQMESTPTRPEQV
eukprot:4292783-Pleurochrysis_carterae.AAC.5